MGFHQRHINFEESLSALKSFKLRFLYDKTESLLFEDELSSLIYREYCAGKSEDEILHIIYKED